MDFSNAADMYVGSSPVKEAWMNGKLVWHRPDNIGLMLTGGQIIDYTQVMAEGKTYEVSEVVGVTVQEAEVSFIIHPNYAKNGQTCYWSWGSPSLSESLFRTRLETEADDHTTGYEDTQTLIADFDRNGASWGRPSNEYAVYAADNVTFSNEEKGYLMSAGEAVIIFDNRIIINALLAKINGADTIVDGKGIWTSTLNFDEDTNEIQAWYLIEEPGKHRIDGCDVQAMKYVRPIARLINN